MSNEVYGYFTLSHHIDIDEFFKELEQETGLGIQQASVSQLINYPDGLLPKPNEKNIVFIIGDRPGKLNTTYVTDYMDYAPESNLGGLPYEGRERLKLLINLLNRIISNIHPVRFTVAITECSQIEEVKRIDYLKMDVEILSDFEDYAPPDCIYDFELKY